MAEHFCCPQCGNENLQATTEVNTQTTGSNYSGGKGCLGFLMFGPLGLLCGSCGQGQRTTTTNTTYWNCPKCGKRFMHPDDMRKNAETTWSSSKFMLIFSIIIALLLFIFIEPVEMKIFMAAVFLGCGIILYFVFNKVADNIANEAYHVREDMERFKK